MTNRRETWIEEQVAVLANISAISHDAIPEVVHLCRDAMAVADATPVEGDSLEQPSPLRVVPSTASDGTSPYHPEPPYNTLAAPAQGGVREALQRLIECIEAENVSGVPVKHSIATRFAIQDAKAAMNAPPAPVGEVVVEEVVCVYEAATKLNHALVAKQFHAGDKLKLTVRREP